MGYLLFDSSTKGYYEDLVSDTSFCAVTYHGNGAPDDSEGCNDYFRTIGSSLYQCWILLIKVNTPDIYTPYLDQFPTSAIFFVIFELIAQFFLLRILLAACFSTYKKDYEMRFKSRLANQKKCVLFAFQLISDDFGDWNETFEYKTIDEAIQMGRLVDDSEEFDEIIRNSSLSSSSDFKEENEETSLNERKGVSFLNWLCLMRHSRPDLIERCWVYHLIFATHSSTSSNVSWRDVNDEIGDHCEKFGSLNWEEFKLAAKDINLQVYEDETILPKEVGEFYKQLKEYNARFRKTVTSKMYEFILNMLILLSAGYVIWYRGDIKAYDLIRILSVIFFTAEVSIRMLAIGPKRFFADGINIVEALSVLILFVSWIVLLILGSKSSVFSLMAITQLIRSLRLFKVIPYFEVTINTVSQTLPFLGRILLVFTLYLYSFAVFGMNLFTNDLRAKDVTQQPYNTFNYFSLNFQTFLRSMLTLFQLLLGPQFPTFVEALAEGSGSWLTAVLYCGCYYIIVVLFVQNVIAAFILETYLRQWQYNLKMEVNSRKGRKEDDSPHKKTLSDILPNLISTARRKFRMYSNQSTTSQDSDGTTNSSIDSESEPPKKDEKLFMNDDQMKKEIDEQQNWIFKMKVGLSEVSDYIIHFYSSNSIDSTGYLPPDLDGNLNGDNIDGGMVDEEGESTLMRGEKDEDSREWSEMTGVEEAVRDFDNMEDEIGKGLISRLSQQKNQDNIKTSLRSSIFDVQPLPNRSQSLLIKRPPPHHELYDSVFHGAARPHAKIRIRMEEIDSGFRTAPTLSESRIQSPWQFSGLRTAEVSGYGNTNKRRRKERGISHQPFSSNNGQNILNDGFDEDMIEEGEEEEGEEEDFDEEEDDGMTHLKTDHQQENHQSTQDEERRRKEEEDEIKADILKREIEERRIELELLEQELRSMNE